MLTKLWNLRKQKIIEADRVYLRYPLMSDWKDWAEIRQQSRNHLTPWEPRWSHNTLTRTSFRARLRQYARDAKDDIGHAFFIFRKEDDQIVGSITLSNIRRGVSQTGTIGYWTGHPFVRMGYMREAILALLPELFDRFGLRRIEAACLLENEPSASLLEKIGFTREGQARQYLCINGVWQDHLLYAVLKGDENQACPASADRNAGSTPSLAIADNHLASSLLPKTKS